MVTRDWTDRDCVWELNMRPNKKRESKRSHPYRKPSKSVPEPQQVPIPSCSTPPRLENFVAVESSSKSNVRKVAKRFRFVNEWPKDERLSKKTIIATSPGSASINVISTQHSSTLIDCGAIAGSYSSFSIDDNLKTHQIISQATGLLSSEKRTYSEADFLPNKQRKQIWADTTPVGFNVRDSITKYLDNLLKDFPNKFKNIIITSSDADCWDFMPYLFFDSHGNWRNKYEVECFIFHGHPMSYSSKFLKVVGQLMEGFKEQDTEFYFTSLPQALDKQSDIHTYVSKNSEIQPKIYYDVRKKAYRTTHGDLPSVPPYAKYLKLSSNAYLFFPMINCHHRMWRMDRWRVPTQYRENEDCLPVAIIVNGFSFLYLADLYVELQLELLDNVLEQWIPNKEEPFCFDGIFISHNGQYKDICWELLTKFRPKIVISPIFAHKGYPTTETFQMLQKLPSLVEFDNKHKFFSYVEHKGEPMRQDQLTDKGLFSLLFPLSILIDAHGGAYIRQFSSLPIAPDPALLL